jgi:hypothetical protein
MVRYTANTTDFKIKLDFAAGYPEASRIKITDLKTKKAAAFLHCAENSSEAENVKFCLYKPAKNFDPKASAILAVGQDYETTPETLTLTYFYQDKTYPITLKKQK